MNGGTGKSGDGSRVPAVAIPAGVRKTIENIKEIASNHSDEEVYAMLRECSMDPNETCQKLLLQDTFHEVKRRRDKKKEGGNRETVDPKNRPGAYARAGRFSSRYLKDKAGKSAASLKENGAITDKTAEKGKMRTESVSPRKEAKASTSTPSLPTGQPNGPVIIDHPPPSHSRSPNISTANPKAKDSLPPLSTTAANNSKLKPKPSSPSVPIEKEGSDGPHLPAPVPGAGILAKPPSSSLLVAAVCSSTSDPVLVPALDVRSPRAAGTIRRPVGSQRNSGTSFTNRETIHAAPSAHVRPSNGRPSSSSRPSSGSRPTSGYNSRGSIPNGTQRGAPNKEWKPKSMNNIAPAEPSNVPPANTDSAPSNSEHVTVSVSSAAVDSNESTSMVTKVEKKPDEPEVGKRQHVIIPNHLQVPESEKCGLSFGSFDSNFALIVASMNGPNMSDERTESYKPEIAMSQQAEESAEESTLSPQEVPSTIPVIDQPSMIRQSAESFSPSDGPTSASTVDADGTDMQSKEAEATVNLQDSAEFLSAPYTSFEQADHAPSVNQSQPLDVPESASQQQQDGAVNHIPNSMVNHLLTENQPQDMDVPETAQVMAHDDNAGSQPNVTVQQPFDMSSNYYAQSYRPTADSDGRFSPFLVPGAAIKYGNISVLTGQAGHVSAEGGNPVILSPSGSSTVASPAGSMIPTSISVTQQTLPVFRHPVGALQLPHYHPNYLAYNQYMSPFYVPSPTLHPFLGNAAGAAFPQQSPAGGIYAAPPGAAGAAPAVPMRYPQVGGQYKPAVNTGTLTNAGTASVYSAYGMNTIGYAGTSPVTTGNPGENDEIAGVQFKENNMYITGQLNETSAMWMPAPGRELSTLQPGSFYGLSPQGAAAQHLAFAPGPPGPTAQAPPTAAAGPHAFAGIYPHTAAMAIPHHQLLQPPPPHSVEMVGPTAAGVGPTASLYLPPPAPQRTPINWAGSY